MTRKNSSNSTGTAQFKYDLKAINDKLSHGDGCFTTGVLKGKPCLRYYQYCNGRRLVVSGYTERACFLAMDKKRKEYLMSLEKADLYEKGLPEADFIGSFKKWLIEVKQKERNKPTSYDRSERTFNTRIVGDGKFDGLRIKDVTSKKIDSYMYYLLYEAPRSRNGSGYSLSEVHKVYDLLNQFFRYFYEKDPASNPMTTVKKLKEKRELNGQLSGDSRSIDNDFVFTDVEITKFEQECWKAENSKWGLVLIFMLETFIRAGEMRALKWSNINFEERSVNITENTAYIRNRSADKSKRTTTVFMTPKTKESIRTVVISDVAFDAITEWRARTKYNKAEDRIATTDGGKVITHSCLCRALDRVINKAKVKRISLHGLRHSGISYWLRHGVPLDVISKMAGHASTKITEQRYYHVINDQRKDALSQMNRINSQRKI